MKLIFFDEVKVEVNYPHYHIGAVCVDEAHLAEVEEGISVLSEKTFGKRELCAETEFHAADIYHRKRNFKDWNDFGKRIHIIERFVEILSMKEVLLIDIQINRKLLSASQSADEIAFMFLCERANDLVKSNNSLGMLIGDRESDRMSEGYSTSLSSYRAHGTDFAFGKDIHNLVDSVHFTHSHLSRFLQLADVYAWLLQFRLRNRDSKDQRHAAVLNLFKKENINLFPAKYKEWPKT